MITGSVYFFLFLLILSPRLYSLNNSLFENRHTHRSEGEITEYQIIGERCSGTTFCALLLRKNFPNINHRNILGHKHFPLWVEFPISQKTLKQLNYTNENVDFTNSENYLIVCIVRNIYDWIRSFYLRPHHVSNHLKKDGFFHFVSSKWQLKDKWQLIDGFNPYKREPFKNVLELRHYKIKNFLAIGNKVANFCLVKYEDLAEHPEEFIAFLSDFYDLPKVDQFIPHTTYKNQQKPYKPRQYFHFSKRAIHFINTHVNWDIENEIGYSIKWDRS